MPKPAIVIDQVLRKQAFTRARDVTITHRTAPSWRWVATWSAADGSPREATDFDLGRLLDALEALDDGPQPRE